MSAEPRIAHRALIVERCRLLLQRHLRRTWYRRTRDDGHLGHLMVGLDAARIALLAEAVEPPIPLPAVAALDVSIAANREAEAKVRPDMPAAVLDRLGLRPASIELLLVAATLQRDAELSRMVAPVTGAPQLTAGLLIELCADDDTHRAALESAWGPDWPLRRLRLIEAGDDRRWQPRPPPMQAPVLVAASVERLLAGLPPFDDVWPVGAARVETEGPTLDQIVADDRARLDRLLGDAVADRLDGPAVLVGRSGSGRRALTRAHALAAGRVLVRVEPDALPREPAAFDRTLGALLRDVRLAEGVAFIRADGFSARDDRRPSIMARLLSVLRPTAVVSATPETAPAVISALPGARTATLNVGDTEGRRAIYARLLVQHAFEMSRRQLTRLVDTYRLVPGDLDRALTDVRRSTDGTELGRGAFDDAVRRQVRSRLSDLATAIDTGQTWADLVVTDELRGSIDELIAHARHRTEVFEEWGFSGKVGGRGRGLACLFSGPPGTGKTMTATLIGKALGLEVFQVDLSRVVDKYVGETEKNLGRLFDEASRAPVVLLFDEADSLFAARTEVQSSNDRYANLEVNYLLQRMERFEGVSILTTNRETAIDPAFKRRLRFRLHFDPPGAAHRERLWRSMVPPGCRVAAEIDWAGLATQWEMTGALIRNAMLRAAFLAAARDAVIDEALIRQAARSELIEMGRLGN